jgi:hypothetical protein
MWLAGWYQAKSAFSRSNDVGDDDGFSLDGNDSLNVIVS